MFFDEIKKLIYYIYIIFSLYHMFSRIYYNMYYACIRRLYTLLFYYTCSV